MALSEKHKEHARELARSFPPLTEDQKRTIRLLLAPALRKIEERERQEAGK